jgi:sialate O-acetylesterase
MKQHFSTLLLSFLFLSASAQIKLPRLIRDSMVLQRDTRLKLWGWASAGEKVAVSFRKKTYRTTTGADGKWTLFLPPQKAGGPYTLQITGKNEITLNDVLVGDVWVCAGQSNMVHQMNLHSERYAEDIASANNPLIRHFWIPTMTDLQQAHDDLPTGYWKSANPQDVLQFSAVAYFFAKKLFDKYGLPIGLINASVGGTPIEAWTSEEGLKEFPSLLTTIQKNKDTAYVNGANRAARAWSSSLPRPQDQGLQGTPWYSTAYTPKNWRTITVPGYWEDQGIRNLDGIVWYRKEITLPASMSGRAGRMALGRIVDADVVYVNGQQVGTTGYQYPQRRYSIPDGLLKAGKNVVVVKVTNNSGKGGFVPDKPYYIAAGNDTLDLKGDWQYKVGAAFEPPKNFVAGVSEANQPTSLYNAMLAPATHHTIKGILWYQGESNIRNAAEYEKLLPALIRDWRSKWQQGDLPFLFVQLPNYDDVQYLPTESPWAVLREGTRKTLSVPSTGMAVTIDVGEWNDIHPDRKKEVGERLALAAMKVAYGEKAIVHSGPLVQSGTLDGNKIMLTFSNTGSGLTTADGEALSSFAIAGADKKFVWANATIKDDKVIVWSDAVAAPRYVRYAWADNPDNPNLFNKEGLPASPFQAEINP